MSDADQLRQIITAEMQDCPGYTTDQLSSDFVTLYQYYNGEKVGPLKAKKGRSAVVSRDVMEVIEWAMPAFMRIFTSSDEVVRFDPAEPGDEEQADQRTDYCNFVFMHDNDGYRVLYEAIKNCLMQKIGPVKVWWDEKKEVVEEEYRDLDDMAYQALLSEDDSPKAKPTVSIDVLEYTRKIDGKTEKEAPDLFAAATEAMAAGAMPPFTHDLRIRKTTRRGKVCVRALPPEELLVSNQATCIDDAPLVAHRFEMTRSDMRAMGWTEADLENLPFNNSRDYHETPMADVRRRDTGHVGESTANTDKSSGRCLLAECWVRADMDEDGVAELRHVWAAGNGGALSILPDPQTREMSSIVKRCQIADFSAILMPHRVHGLALAELVKDIQEQKTAMRRGLNTSIYFSMDPKLVVRHDGAQGQALVDLNDLSVSRPGQYIKEYADNAVRPLMQPSNVGTILPALESLDRDRAARTGMNDQAAGIDADVLSNETAKKAGIMQAAAESRVELMARTMAETGLKRVFLLISDLLRTYQDRERVVRLRNKFVTIDPREWTREFDVRVVVGLGTGDRNAKLQQLGILAQKQEQILLQAGPNNPIVGLEEYHETLTEMAKTAGWKDAQRFFKDPANAQMQAGPQGPSEAEIEAQQKARELQMKAETDVRVAEVKAATDLRAKQYAADLEHERKMREIELDHHARMVELGAEQRNEMLKMANGSPGGQGNLPTVV